MGGCGTRGTDGGLERACSSLSSAPMSTIPATEPASHKMPVERERERGGGEGERRERGVEGDGKGEGEGERERRGEGERGREGERG